jgi:hypothetical protein
MEGGARKGESNAQGTVTGDRHNLPGNVPDAEKEETLKTIRAYITLKSGELISRLFNSWQDVGAWIDRHHDHLKRIDAELIATNEIRQGKE